VPTAPGLHASLQGPELRARGMEIRKLCDRADSFDHQALFPCGERRAFGPAAVNVGQSQRVDELPSVLHPLNVRPYRTRSILAADRPNR
jgi:hypothetical protein